MYRLYLSLDPASGIGGLGLYHSSFSAESLILFDKRGTFLPPLYETEFSTMYGALIPYQPTGQRDIAELTYHMRIGILIFACYILRNSIRR